MSTAPQTFPTFCFKLNQYYQSNALATLPPKSQTLFAPMPSARKSILGLSMICEKYGQHFTVSTIISETLLTYQL